MFNVKSKGVFEVATSDNVATSDKVKSQILSLNISLVATKVGKLEARRISTTHVSCR